MPNIKYKKEMLWDHNEKLQCQPILLNKHELQLYKFNQCYADVDSDSETFVLYCCCQHISSILISITTHHMKYKYHFKKLHSHKLTSC